MLCSRSPYHMPTIQGAAQLLPIAAPFLCMSHLAPQQVVLLAVVLLGVVLVPPVELLVVTFPCRLVLLAVVHRVTGHAIGIDSRRPQAAPRPGHPPAARR